jgi:predicted MFS family arabinose efflux permease
VEAIKTVADQDHGSALGVYTAFLDCAMGITGPVAGLIAGTFGYSVVFLYGSAAAGCAFLVILLLFHLRRAVVFAADTRAIGA